MNGGAELLPLRQHGHQEGGQLVDVLRVLAGGGVLGHCVLGLRHDLAAQVSSGDLQGVAPVLKNLTGFVHEGLQLVLRPESVF